jgi:hypothetical protein
MTNNTNSVKGGAMPRINCAAAMTRDRRQFIGGSDARVIMGRTRRPCCVSGRKNAGKSPVPISRTC